jgi:hypothetical protein
MNFKTTIYLFTAVVALIAALAVATLTGSKKAEEGKLLPGLESKDVTKLTIDRHQPAETKLVFAKTGEGQWKLEEPYPARVDGRQVDSVVSGLTSLTTVTKGADLTSNPAQFGLDRPSLTVILDAGDKSTTVNFGKVTIGSGEHALVYVNTSARKEPTAVKRSSLSALFRDVPDAQTAGDLFKNVSEFRSRDLVLENAFNAADVARTVRLKGEKGEVVINKTTGGTWQFEKPAGFGDADLEGDFSGGPDAAPSGVKPLLNALSSIRAGGGDDFIENVSDFKQYGLEPGKEAGPRIEIVRNAPGGDASAPPVTETLTVGKKEDKGDKVFVRPGTENVVAKVPANLIEPVRKVIENPSALRSRTLLPTGTAGVDALDIRVGSDPPIELRKLADGWKLFGGPGDAKSANTTAIQGLLTDLGGKRVVREFPDPKLSDADKGFDKPSAVVTLWVNGIVEEPKKDEKKEENKGGEEQQVPPAKAGDKAANPPEKKDEPKDKSTKPAEKKDDAAKPAERKEEPKGPAKPKLKDATAKLIFGKRDKDLLYVRREQGGTKADFAVAESLLPKLTRGRLDYLDPTLPSFNVENVTKLTYTRGGETWVVEKVKKEKEPSTWVIRQPANLADRPADGFKVSSLLGDLGGLRAERLWAEKATDRELERFGLKPPKFTATVTLPDEKDKERTYQFGAETDDKTQVYAKQAERDLVFSVGKSAVDAFQQADLTDPTVFTLDLSKVTGMKLTGWKEFSVNGQPQTLDLERKGANNWAVKGNPNYKLSASQAEAFLANLATVRAEKFVTFKTGPKPEQKLTPADGALLVEVTVDGEKEPVTLALGAEAEGGKSYYAASYKAKGDVFLLPKDRFEKYKTKPGAFAAE